MKNKFNPMKYDNISRDGIYTNMDNIPFLNLKTGEFLLPFNPEQKRILAYGVSKNINIGAIAYPGIPSWKMWEILKVAGGKAVDLRIKEIYMLTHIKRISGKRPDVAADFDEHDFLAAVLAIVKTGARLAETDPNFMQYSSAKISDLYFHYTGSNPPVNNKKRKKVNPVAYQLGVKKEIADYLTAEQNEKDSLDNWETGSVNQRIQVTNRSESKKSPVLAKYLQFYEFMKNFDDNTDYINEWY